RQLCEAIDRHCAPGEWGRIVVEMWIDSGRIIAYPVLKKTGERKVIVQATLALLLEQSDALPDPDLEPTQFNSEAQKLELEVADVLLVSSMRNPGKAAIAALRGKNPFKVYIQSADDSETGRFTSV